MNIWIYGYTKVKKTISNSLYKITYRFVKPKIIISKASFSGDGIFIDIRYWIARPDKINSKTYPYLITSKNQKLELMYFSKFGIIKSKLRKHTNTGILLFYNKDRAVSMGESVVLYWDGLKSEDIVIN